MPKIIIIAAVAENLAIGKKGDLPWHLPEDLQHFKKLTLGKTILMGLKTFESLGNKALPNRTNVVLCNDASLQLPEGVVKVTSLEEADTYCNNLDEVWIAGGGMVYSQYLPKADVLELTHVHQTVEDADVFFPKWNADEWNEIKREDHSEFSFVTYEKKKERE